MQACGAGCSRNVGGGSCYVPRAARSFAFGELAHIEALVFCVRAYGRAKEICFRRAGAHQGACVLRPSSARVEHPGSGAGCSRNVGGFVLCTERRAFIRFRGAGAHRGACSFVARDRLAVSGVCRFVTSDCMTRGRDYEFRVFDPPCTCLPKNHNKFAKNLFTK